MPSRVVYSSAMHHQSFADSSKTASFTSHSQLKPHPDVDNRLLELMKRTGYKMLQENGQRRYGGPPPDWIGSPPPRGCEIFIGKIPRNMMEDELVPVLEKIGQIYELRLMMDFSGLNRGYAFVTYANKELALEAIRKLDNYEVRKGKYLGVVPSVDNCRLFVGGIPRNRTRDEVKHEMSKLTDNVVDVIIYQSAADKSKNRGFAFVEYETHRAAAMARRKLVPARVQLWNSVIAVDWAEPEQEVDEETMANVKILYVRNLMVTTSEDRLRNFCESHCACPIERVKKMRDFAFVHFHTREDAAASLELLNCAELDGAVLEVTYAKPPDKSLLRYVKSAQKLARPGIGPVAGNKVHQHLVAAATQLYQRNVLPKSNGFIGPSNGSGYSGDMVADAFANSWFADQQYLPYGNLMDSSVPFSNRSNRGAAGLRSAGARQAVANLVRDVLNPRPPKFYADFISQSPCVDYIQSGLAVIPTTTNSLSLKPAFKSFSEILYEYCKQYGWGEPHYEEMFSGITKDHYGGDMPVFMLKVTVPAFWQWGSFGSQRFSTSWEEAKEVAASCFLQRFGMTPPDDDSGGFSGANRPPGSTYSEWYSKPANDSNVSFNVSSAQTPSSGYASLTSSPTSVNGVYDRYNISASSDDAWYSSGGHYGEPEVRSLPSIQLPTKAVHVQSQITPQQHSAGVKSMTDSFSHFSLKSAGGDALVGSAVCAFPAISAAASPLFGTAPSFQQVFYPSPGAVGAGAYYPPPAWPPNFYSIGNATVASPVNVTKAGSSESPFANVVAIDGTNGSANSFPENASQQIGGEKILEFNGDSTIVAPP